MSSYLIRGLAVEHLASNGPGLTPSRHAMAALRGLSEDEYDSIFEEFRAQIVEAQRTLGREMATEQLATTMVRAHIRSVLVVGDSITADPTSWANILTAVLSDSGIRVDNRAVSGSTTSDVLAVVSSASSEKTCSELVLIAAGINDSAALSRVGGPRVSLEETARNFDLIRQISASRWQAPIYFGVPLPIAETMVNHHWYLSSIPTRPREEYAHGVRALVRALAAETCDAGPALGASETESVYSDGLHLTVTGSLLVAREWIRFLNQSLPSTQER